MHSASQFTEVEQPLSDGVIRRYLDATDLVPTPTTDNTLINTLTARYTSARGCAVAIGPIFIVILIVTIAPILIVILIVAIGPILIVILIVAIGPILIVILIVTIAPILIVILIVTIGPILIVILIVAIGPILIVILIVAIGPIFSPLSTQYYASNCFVTNPIKPGIILHFGAYS